MNTVILSGRIVNTLEKKTSLNGNEYLKFCLAVDKRNKDKQTVTMFVDCFAYSHSMNYLAKYCHKGQKIVISGELDIRKVDGDDGKQTRYWSVVVNQVEAEKPTEQNNEQPFEM